MDKPTQSRFVRFRSSVTTSTCLRRPTVSAPEGLSQELRDVLDPLLREIESLNERIAEYDRRIEQIAEVYPGGHRAV